MVARFLAASQSASFGQTHGATCRALATKWNMPAELAIDVAALALYDVIIMAGTPSCSDCCMASSHSQCSLNSSARTAVLMTSWSMCW